MLRYLVVRSAVGELEDNLVVDEKNFRVVSLGVWEPGEPDTFVPRPYDDQDLV